MYQYSVTDDNDREHVKKYFWLISNESDKEIILFSDELFAATLENLDKVDEIIKRYIQKGWPFNRLGEVEKNVLRVAITEFLNFNTPAYAVLDDYVTIARTYVDENIASFVNALLDNFRKRRDAELL